MIFDTFSIKRELKKLKNLKKLKKLKKRRSAPELARTADPDFVPLDIRVYTLGDGSEYSEPVSADTMRYKVYHRPCCIICIANYSKYKAKSKEIIEIIS